MRLACSAAPCCCCFLWLHISTAACRVHGCSPQQYKHVVKRVGVGTSSRTLWHLLIPGVHDLNPLLQVAYDKFELPLPLHAFGFAGVAVSNTELCHHNQHKHQESHKFVLYITPILLPLASLAAELHLPHQAHLNCKTCLMCRGGTSSSCTPTSVQLATR